MTTRRIVLAALALLFIGPCVGVYLTQFHMWTTAHVESVSPDGMYKCELTEKSSSGQSVGQVVLYRRVSSSATEGWEVLDTGSVHNDSVVRGNYSIDWEYNEKHRSTRIIVFGDFGGPPFDGTVVYERRLDPQAALGQPR